MPAWLLVLALAACSATPPAEIPPRAQQFARLENGMNQPTVMFLLGPPMAVVNREGTRQVWVYEMPQVKVDMAEFENGKLVGWRHTDPESGFMINRRKP